MLSSVCEYWFNPRGSTTGLEDLSLTDVWLSWKAMLLIKETAYSKSWDDDKCYPSANKMQAAMS